eukprot:12366153-Ditylum_brightwellii.AAC.1
MEIRFLPTLPIPTLPHAVVVCHCLITKEDKYIAYMLSYSLISMEKEAATHCITFVAQLVRAWL